MQNITICVYRDLTNRVVGEPDDGPMAWDAHRERRRVIAEMFADPGFKIEKNADAEDETHTHEVAETVVQILKEPTTNIVLSAAAIYVGKIIAKQIDDALGRGVLRPAICCILLDCREGSRSKNRLKTLFLITSNLKRAPLGRFVERPFAPT